MRTLDKGYGFKILYPTIDFFLKEIEGGNNFNYIRFNHGIIDGLISHYESPQQLETDFKNGGAELVLNNIQPKYPLWNYLYSNNLKEQLSTTLNLLFNLNHPQIMAGFDSNIGMGLGEGEFHYKHPKERKRIEFIKYFVDTNKINSYYTGLPKHWAIMDELHEFIEGLEDREYKIIFLGPEYINNISNKLSSRITNINIPLTKANQTFDLVLDSIESQIGNGRGIVFHSTGHMLSSVLVSRFKDTNICSFDFGRGFDWLLIDEPEKVPHYEESWISYYKENTKQKLKEFVQSVRNGSHLISMKKVNLEYTNITTSIPDINYFLNKIKNDEVIRFLRVNHGFIDGIHYAYHNRYDEFINDFSNGDYIKVAKNIVFGYYDKQWGFGHMHNISFELENAVANLLKLLRTYDELKGVLDISLSLGVGLNEFWGVWDKEYPLQVGRGKFADTLTNIVSTQFFYSGVFKYFTIKGEISKLFNLLNSKDYNVVFLGPERFGRYQNIFGIENYHFIQIPIKGAVSHIDSFTNDIVEINNNHKKTIVFLQCGHVISASIIDRLMNTDISVLDIGRSFDILMKHEFIGKGQEVECWTGIDENQLIRHVDFIENNF